ncbi:hypothetical protein V8E54_012305 [Elaphomyces granulatus]
MSPPTSNEGVKSWASHGGRPIRKWAREFEETEELPLSQRGAHRKYWPEHSPFGFPVSTVWKPPDNGINNGRTVIDIPAITSSINGALGEELEELWQGGTGLCTSWCVAVANDDNNNNQFVFADRGEHRCCSDPTNGIIIDSSARLPIAVEKNTPFNFCGKTWLLEDGRLYTMRGDNRIEFIQLQGWQEAMKRCLVQLMGNDEIVCLFR